MVALKAITAAAALSGVALAAPSLEKKSPSDGWQNRIKNVIVLVEENRSFDTFAGGLTYDPRINGLIHNNYCNYLNASDPKQSDEICAGPRANDVASDDPNHSISGVNMQLFSTFHPDEALVKSGKLKENLRGFVTEQSITYDTINLTRAAEVINYYTPDQVRIFNAIASNFTLFDRWFAAVPGPTNPNRAYITSGTSAGHGSNDEAFLEFAMPQRSVFQQLTEAGISWTNYQNSTTGPIVANPTQGFLPDAAFYNWTYESGAYLTNIKPLEQFYKDAAAGTLPQFTYLNPECCSYQSFHPPSPISDGEYFIKGIYEAIRNSPQWNETLFILTFDEHGGFADHVYPPVNVPPGDNLVYTEKAQDGKPITFDFTRLGVRVPTVLVSPWLRPTHVEGQGQHGQEYTHTSILAFISKLWGLEYLTPRVAWSATFEHLISDKYHDESPKTLPDAFPFN